MAETVLVRGEGGWSLPHDLPLHPNMLAKVTAGEALVVGPCDADGNLLEPELEPEPVEAPAVKRPAAKQTASKE